MSPDEILDFNQYSAMNENSQYLEMLAKLVDEMADEMDSKKEPDAAKAATFLQFFSKWVKDDRASAAAFWNENTNNAILRTYIKPMAWLKFSSSNDDDFRNMVMNDMIDIKVKSPEL